MRIGMATTIPNTPRQKVALLSLANTLLEAALQAENLAEIFGSESSVVMVEGRDLELFLTAMSEQLLETARKGPDASVAQQMRDAVASSLAGDLTSKLHDFGFRGATGSEPNGEKEK
jgi:hypothetical protein